MVAVARDRNQPTFKPTKAAPANSSRVENVGRRATGGGGGCCWEEGRTCGLLAWEAVVWWGKRCYDCLS